MLKISPSLSLLDSEITLHAVRAQGAGGQNVNKVSSAIHLRFDIRASSLPESCKEKLLALDDQRVSSDGIVVIKAQQHRSQEKNREDALQRLALLIRSVLVVRRKRTPTRPTRASQQKRLEHKIRHGRNKALRGNITD